MDEIWLVAGGVGLILGIVVVLWWGRSPGTAASRQAHEAAQDREPPVELGDIYEFGVVEFTGGTRRMPRPLRSGRKPTPDDTNHATMAGRLPKV